jgi:hypothetical protein
VIHLVCRTSADDAYDQYEYGILTLDLELAMYLLKLIGIAAIFKATNGAFHRASFFRAEVSFHRDWLHAGNEDLTTEQAAEIDECEVLMESAEWTVLPQWYKPPEEHGRTDADTLAVDEQSVLFQAYPHGGEAYEIETQVLTKDLLAELANDLMELHAQAQAKTAPRHGRQSRVISIDR